MSQNTTKFARTATVESTLHELRLAAEAGDSTRVVTAAGELRSLLNLFKRIKSPFKNVGDVKTLVNPSGNPIQIPGHSGPVSRGLMDALNTKVQSEALDAGQNSWKGVQRQMVQNFVPNDPNNPTALMNQETLKALIESGNIGGSKMLQALLGDNRLKAILNKEIDPKVITTKGRKPSSVTMYQMLTDPSLSIQIHQRPQFEAYVDRVATEFASQYKGTAVFNYMKGLALKTLLVVLGAKVAASIAIPASAAVSMGSPSSSAVQQAADINTGGSEPVTPLSGSTPTKGTGHPAMTNSNNFGNLGGVQGGSSIGNDPNAPFSQRIIDYSSMYRENASQDSRVALAQQQDQVEVPQEVRDHLNQVPDPQAFVEHIAALIRANGGPESSKAIGAVNAYVAQIDAQTAPLMKSIR